MHYHAITRVCQILDIWHHTTDHRPWIVTDTSTDRQLCKWRSHKTTRKKMSQGYGKAMPAVLMDQAGTIMAKQRRDTTTASQKASKAWYDIGQPRDRESLQENLKKEKGSKDRRNIYFVIRYSGQWHKTEHKTISKLRSKFGLKLLRVRMVHTSKSEGSAACGHSLKSDERHLR